MSHISRAEIDHFNEHGYVVVRDLVSHQAIADLRQMFATVADSLAAKATEQGWSDTEYRQLPFEQALNTVPRDVLGAAGRSWRAGLDADLIRTVHAEPELLDAMHQILGPDLIASPAYNARPKLPHQELTVVPWHQDAGYYGEDSQRNPAFTAWLPLVPVDADTGCMQVVPGSQDRGFRRHDREQAAGQFLFISDDDINDDEIVTCVMEPGDALLMHHMVYHRSLPNVSERIRWSIDLRYYRKGQDPHPGITANQPAWHLPAPARST